jgi:IS30 family transposase
MAWSPEQIARRLPFDFPADDSMRISHEAIYQALYVQGRGALRRELTASSAPAVHCACPAPGSTGRENPSLPPRS